MLIGTWRGDADSLRSLPAVRKPPPLLPFDAEHDPFRREWLRLKPGERLVRSWRLRRRLKNPQAAHDARSLPRL